MEYIAEVGESIYTAVDAAKRMMYRECSQQCILRFADMSICIYRDSNKYDIFEKYDLMVSLRNMGWRKN